MEQAALNFDVLLIADMARDGDIGLRIRREVQALSRQGYRCALRHLPTHPKRAISPDIQRCVRDGLAEPVAENASVTARLAIVFSPGAISAPVELQGLKADHVVLVIDRPPVPEQMGYWHGFGIGSVHWAPTNRWVRGALEEIGFPVPLFEEDWRAIAVPCRPRPHHAPSRTRPVIGRVSTADSAQWPENAELVDAVYGTHDGAEVWIHGPPPNELASSCGSASEWVTLTYDEIAVERFVEAIDSIVYAPGATIEEVPEAAIVTAMVSGKPVVLPPHFRPHFGPSALYAEPEHAVGVALDVLQDEIALQQLRQQAVARCQLTNPKADYLARIENLIGPPSRGAPAPTTSNPQPKRALFIPSSGVGMGHATRLLAIARRLDTDMEPVFATLGQAGEVIERFGYRADYIPSASDTGASLADWDRWFRYELGEILDRTAPDVVVFDGNNPTPGLVQAALAHGACRLVWVRRGMGPNTPSPYLSNARFFDCIIEPGEYATSLDRGPTARLRHQVVQVSPIRLLDSHEIRSRDDARVEMGLDPDKPAVLIQPGSGANRDIVDLTDRLVRDLSQVEGLQIVIAEWSNGALSLPIWPGTKRLQGYPISRWYAAFDFSVSAAGYNTFHEVIALGLPTIFVANRHPSMDDQGARATYAQDHGVGFDLKDDEMHLFPTLCRAMLTPEANQVLRAASASFDQANGASEAAAIIKSLAGLA